MPKPKELQFFNAFYDRGIEWYEKKFIEGEGFHLRGEITPNYMYVEKALQRMREHIPVAKLFIILRNPFERAYSNYQLVQNQFGGLSFRDALRQDPGLIRRGRYAHHINSVLTYYPRSQLKILFYEDIKNCKEKFLDDLYAFLGISTGFRPQELNIRYNRVIMPKTQRILKQLKLEWTVEMVKASLLGNWVRTFHASKEGEAKSAVSEEVYMLLRSEFESDILDTQALVGRDLTSWLEWRPKVQ